MSYGGDLHICISKLDHNCLRYWSIVNTLRPRQNGRHFADDTFKRIFMNENVRISNNISLKFVPKGLTNNIPALVQIMAWRQPDDKPLSEPMTVNLLTHICVTRPQWVNWTPRNKLLWNLNKNKTIFIWETISENVGHFLLASMCSRTSTHWDIYASVN